jgi:uncharacterized protein
MIGLSMLKRSALSTANSRQIDFATVDWRKIVIFCILTLTLTWLWWIIRFFPHVQPDMLIDRTALGPLDVPVGMFGPLLAAVILKLLYKEEFRGSLGLKRSWNVYALAYLVPTTLGIAAIWINHLAGWARFDWAGASPLALVPGQILITLLAALTAIGEEYGWRGYLLPRLLPLGTTKASLIVGIIWGGWHLPLLVTGLTYPGQTAILSIFVFLLSITLLSFLFTWFSRFSRGSVLVAALVHGALNALSELTSPQHISAGNPLIVNPFGLTTAIVLFLAVVLYGLRFQYLLTTIKRYSP